MPFWMHAWSKTHTAKWPAVSVVRKELREEA